MQFNNSTVIIFKDNSSQVLNIGDIINKYKCNKLSESLNTIEYELIDNIYINTLGTNNKLEITKINKITHRISDESLVYLNMNDDVNFLSNIICFNNKQKTIFSQNTSNLDKKYIIQNNTGIEYKFVNNISNLDLDKNLGYLVGYWLLRGGFFKIDKNTQDYPSWSGREQDINRIKHILSDQTNLTKPFKENLQLLLLLENKYTEFFINNFLLNNKTNSIKTLPDWILIAPQDFLQGLFYGLVAANSYISNDSKGNFYLAIKVSNSGFIKLLHNIFKARFGIYSRIIGDNNHLSFKFNNKLYEFISNGIEKKYINIENFEDVTSILNKEILFNNFKIVPWYKFKNNINNLTVTDSYSISLDNNKNIIMLLNGLFTTC